ncbi:uncharacterized protein CLIB1423_18S00364 [[Candida] railenensis]|uniref:Pyridoxamine 5'-phosphate oxidase Alr4036 family FMN-binding domain-containing protein n=1 Tax=[Candida] railenensis TaxID=45579 RepID=A0A9P0QTG5_9ASCO|nr:uncharacterized protein CLIB1423_18S00364 [[Candida] railenensis]
MLQHQYRAPWVNLFNQTIANELNPPNATPQPFITCQLATVDSQGFPHVRTVVYRGFLFNDKNNNILTLTTDKRMSKYEELLHNDKFEIVFYFPISKKQYRFRGIARIIDNEYKPRVDLSSINPRTIIERERSSSDSDSDFDSDQSADSDDDETVLEIPSGTSASSISSPPSACRPVSHSLLSPAVANSIQQYKTANNLSYTNLHDLESVDLSPPSEREWNAEILRQWQGLSKKMRASFRKPAPKTKMDDEKQMKMDKIRRGVDGKKEDVGLENFALIALFTDYVDVYEMEKDKRMIYEKDSYQMWKEDEVCP